MVIFFLSGTYLPCLENLVLNGLEIHKLTNCQEYNLNN